jgi:hypothetical protein
VFRAVDDEIRGVNRKMGRVVEGGLEVGKSLKTERILQIETSCFDVLYVFS